MRDWKDDVILPADKEIATVVKVGEDYDMKIRETTHLPTANYQRTHSGIKDK